ncbi:L,D-transpeptidase [Bartonella sp. HY038]|uniref:L,D-transpeptidase n=1 Tax=Bartonella sp. HY038 TaxID=2759660 RepID=UPI0015F8A334|nr:L,D-transpeptidase [Bartonella sp. HY038]
MKLKRVFSGLALLGAVATSACVTSEGPTSFTSTYPLVRDAGYTIPAIDQSKIKPEFRRQVVSYPTTEKTGTLIVDTKSKFLFRVMPNGKAMRYGIGVGRDGFRWSGTAYIGQKKEWPTWTPPASMVRRQPQLRQYAGGMKPGLNNPLGARALYLYKNGRDTIYRLHGTPEWWTIGSNISSGCIRLNNQDVIDLYSHTPTGTKVIVQ